MLFGLITIMIKELSLMVKEATINESDLFLNLYE